MFSHKHAKLTGILLATTLVSWGLPGGALAAILHVPGDFPTIRAAINAAVDGDEVLVADGVYTGPGNRDLDFGGRLIIVRSENGAANCVIDCESQARGVTFGNGETADSPGLPCTPLPAEDGRARHGTPPKLRSGQAVTAYPNGIRQ